MEAVNTITAAVIGEAIRVHRSLGPGLFESVYEEALVYRLRKLGLSFERQVIIPVPFENVVLEMDFRTDLIVAGTLIVALKSVEAVHPVHNKQLLT